MRQKKRMLSSAIFARTMKKGAFPSSKKVRQKQSLTGTAIGGFDGKSARSGSSVCAWR